MDNFYLLFSKCTTGNLYLSNKVFIIILLIYKNYFCDYLLVGNKVFLTDYKCFSVGLSVVFSQYMLLSVNVFRAIVFSRYLLTILYLMSFLATDIFVLA
jgi:hypothetical protein